MQGDLSLIKMARELLSIQEEFPNRLSYPQKNKISDFEMETFTQIWGNTSGGFETIGGSITILQRTYVFIPVTAEDEACQVYFGGAYAYMAPYSKMFLEDVKNRCVKGMAHKAVYWQNYCKEEREE